MSAIKVALIGAGGKMGCRLTDNLRHSDYDMSYVEISPAGIERLNQRDVKISLADKVIPDADVVILAVPDIYIGTIANQWISR